MFLFKLISYLFGHVFLVVKGNSLEKFINMAANRGIYLWDITKLGANRIRVGVRLSGIRPLRHIARETACRFKIKSRVGIPFIVERMKKRKILVAGAFIFVIVLYILSSFVWFIEIEGNDKISGKDILLAVRQVGLSEGVWRGDIDTAVIEQAIKDKLPIVAWVGVFIEGTKVRIEIVEKKIIGNEISDQPTHIVATKTGLLQGILVLSGQAVVAEGDVVEVGQVLISGEVIPEQTINQNNGVMDLPRYLQAQGVVRARVWYEGYGEAKLVEMLIKPSGKQTERFSIKMVGQEIILKGPSQIPFTKYQSEITVKTFPLWRDFAVPVEFIKVQYLELKKHREERTKTEARKLAEQKAWSQVKLKLPTEHKILKQRVEHIETEQQENLVRVKVLVETLEEIGTEKPFQP